MATPQSFLHCFLHSTSSDKVLPSLLLLLCITSGASAQVRTGSVYTTLPGATQEILSVNSQVATPSASQVGVLTTEVFNAAGTNSADRELTLVLYVKNFNSNNSAVAYRIPFEMPEGTQSVKLETPFVAGRCTWETTLLEAGRDIRDRKNSGNKGPAFQWTSEGGNRGVFGAIVTLSEYQAVKAQNLFVQRQVDAGDYTFNVGPAGTGNLTNSLDSTLAVGDCYADWRLYLPYAGWFISADALNTLLEEKPKSVRALRDYVAAGGVLIVYEADDVGVIESIQEFTDSNTKPLQTEMWTSFNNDMNTWSRSAAGNLSSRDKILESLAAKQLIGRDFANGEILVFAGKLEAILPSVLAGQVASRASASNVGYAVSAETEDDWFYRNLISSVGKPPIWTFCFIVTIFGAILGPGLLYVTARIGRRSLMILLVPALSLVATICIILYGVFHEGFSSYNRITSVQFVDSQSGNGFAWSRQNFFNSLTPKDGLVFDRDTFVRAVESSAGRSQPSSPRENVSYFITRGEQEVWNQWVKPRQQQQLLIGHPLRGQSLPIAAEVNSDKRLELTNLSDDQILLAVIRSRSGDYYLAEDVAGGASRALEPIDKSSVSAGVAKRMVDLRPESPPELRQSSSLLGFRSRGLSRVSNTQNVDEVINRVFQIYLSDKLAIPEGRVCLVTRNSGAIRSPIQATASSENEDLNVLIGDLKW